MTLRPCIDCGRPVTQPRCPPCHKRWQRTRNAKPERAAYRDPAYRATIKYGVCWICGEPGADTRDHVIPIAKGGTNTPENIKPAHRACNSAEGGKLSSHE